MNTCSAIEADTFTAMVVQIAITGFHLMEVHRFETTLDKRTDPFVNKESVCHTHL
jgi:hypothetical protein